MRGWLTPYSPTPPITYCARIRCPNGSDWRGPLNGAFALLQEAFNWELFGDLDAQQTADFWRPLVIEAQSNGDWCMIGAVWPYAAAEPPPHTLVCAGQELARADYPLLYAALDPAFIIDADNFRVPDLTNRMVMGADDGDSGDYPVGATGGEINHTLTVDEMPSHTHTDTGHQHTESAAIPALINGGVEAPAASATPTGSFTGTGTASLTNTGGDMPHNNLPPYMALRWCIVFE